MNDVEHLASQLEKVEHFRGLSAEERKAVITAGKIHRYSKGAVIFSEEDPSAGMYVLLSGQVQLCKHSSEGQVSILAVCKPVIMFNEVSALDEGPNPVTALAGSDCMIWHIQSQELRSLILKHPQIGLGLLRVLAARNRLLVSQFHDLSFRSVLARTAKLLYELSDRGSTCIDRRSHSNYQMAARIATVPEAFSRSLRSLREKGAISCTPQSIEIVDPAALLEAAGVSSEPA
jgi:CRP-like cAMP-binding protein